MPTLAPHAHKELGGICMTKPPWLPPASCQQLPPPFLQGCQVLHITQSRGQLATLKRRRERGESLVLCIDP